MLAFAPQYVCSSIFYLGSPLYIYRLEKSSDRSSIAPPAILAAVVYVPLLLSSTFLRALVRIASPPLISYVRIAYTPSNCEPTASLRGLP